MEQSHVVSKDARGGLPPNGKNAQGPTGVECGRNILVDLETQLAGGFGGRRRARVRAQARRQRAGRPVPEFADRTSHRARRGEAEAPQRQTLAH